MKVSKNAILGFALGVSSLGVFAKPTLAATQIFADNFDDNDFSDWVVRRNMQYGMPTASCMYGGGAALWGIRNGALGIELFSNPCSTQITPKNLDLTSTQAWEYEFDWLMPDSIDQDRAALILWQDSSNWYDLKLFGNSLTVQKVVSGKQYFLTNDSGTFPFEANKSYHFKITYGLDKKITVTVNNLQVVQTQDVTPFVSGYKTLGLSAGVGSVQRSSSYFDNIVVRAITAQADKVLAVPLLKQTDPQWMTEEYDSATKWADVGRTTIQDWGCALTSMAMVMRYYGITTLPDGQTLNPSTLNTWLKSQEDGYLSGGINWVAVTRLTRLINEKFNTVKLEYSRQTTSDLEVAKKEIQNDRPAILEILGHFMVGAGIAADNSTVLIKDPAYTFDKFSQHKESLLSVRKFQPSHTDLSYVIITHAPDLKTVIKDSTGKVTTSESFAEKIIDPTDGGGKQTPNIVETHFAKPADGQYTIEVSQNQVGEYSLKVFSYDAAANLTSFTKKGFVGTDPDVFSLNYQKTGSSSLKRKVSHKKLKKDLQILRKLEHIKNDQVTAELQTLIETEPQKIGEFMKQHQEEISVAASEYIQDEVNGLDN
jgi:hypothetical protein